MAFKDRNNPPDLSSLLVSLQQSDLIKKNPAFYQTVAELIKRTASNISILNNQILAVEQITDDLNTLIQGATFLTHTDQFPTPLGNSRQLLAGIGITFDDTIAGERTINASVGNGGLIPMATGAEPLEIMSNGNGEILLIGFTTDQPV